MRTVKHKRSNKEEEIFATLKFGAYVALNGMVIPALRCVAINWEPGADSARLVFFHDGLVEEPIRYHYECIECEATASYLPKYNGKEIDMPAQILSSPRPMLLPQVSEVVYLRKELEVDFKEINTHVPDWLINSVIRLKVNEALRGKVTGNLRAIHLTWHRDNTEALLTFFHNGEVTPEIENEYEEIFNIAIATSSKWYNEGEKVTPRFVVKKALYPEKIETPKPLKILYSRKEPFTNLPIGEE